MKKLNFNENTYKGVLAVLLTTIFIIFVVIVMNLISDVVYNKVFPQKQEYNYISCDNNYKDLNNTGLSDYKIISDGLIEVTLSDDENVILVNSNNCVLSQSKLISQEIDTFLDSSLPSNSLDNGYLQIIIENEDVNTEIIGINITSTNYNQSKYYPVEDFLTDKIMFQTGSYEYEFIASCVHKSSYMSNCEKYTNNDMSFLGYFDILEDRTTTITLKNKIYRYRGN